MPNKVKFLIAAAGKGTRSGLKYPKSLYKIDDIPIIRRIYSAIGDLDNEPIIVVSNFSKPFLEEYLNSENLEYIFVTQNKQIGMADAVYQARKIFKNYEFTDLFVMWGDLPYITNQTISNLMELHFSHKSDFSFATLTENNPYTIVERDENNNVVSVSELKDIPPNKRPKKGERDIGLFIFNKDKVFKYLKQLLNHYHNQEDEIGFLEIVKVLSDSGLSVNGYEIAKPIEAISFNSKDDLI
jgi:bifunctional UDP-N-acetylglucosamine pyrophosphorylase/glucosamine-1-phosphate N-acetyltransferase